MSIDRLPDKDVAYRFTMEYYSATKRNENLRSAVTWIDLEIIILLGEFVISSVMSHCSKSMKWLADGCDSSILFGKQRKTHPWGLRAGSPKRGEEKRGLRLNFGSFFTCFFLLPLSLPYVNWASQEAVCFTWGPHSSPQTFLCSIFTGFSLFVFWSAPFWTPFSYSNYLTILSEVNQKKEDRYDMIWCVYGI